MNFSEVRERDRHFTQIGRGAEKIIPDMAVGHPVAPSAVVLSHLVNSMASLKDAYLDIAETGNLYAANVILRVFLEHSLKAIAVFFQGTSQDNTLAETYLRLAETEAKAYLKALGDAGIAECLCSNAPLALLFDKGKALSNKERDEIETCFKYKSLIRFIREGIGDSSADSFLLKIIPNYAELSGFVHGGPSTSLILRASESMREQKLLQDAELVVSMFFRIKRYLLELAAAIRPEFMADCERLSQALHELD